jgi:type IV secretion system protein VirB9
MIRTVTCAAVMTSMACSAMALETPQAGPDAHIRTVPYSQFNIVDLVGEVGRETTVTFGPGEQIARVVLGSPDADIWEGPGPDEIKNQPLQNNLPLWPRTQAVTNGQVTTIIADGTQRIYQFRLSAVAADASGSDNPAATFGLIFTYPEQAKTAAKENAAAAAQQRKAARDEQEAKAMKARLMVDPFYGQVNWQYIARPNALWRSQEWPKPDVSDNGWITAFRFQGNVSEPAIYIVTHPDPADRDPRNGCLPGGEERLASFTNKDDRKLVQTTARHFRLRLGDSVMEVCNQNYNAVGQVPGTGTTSPDVVRNVVSAR